MPRQPNRLQVRWRSVRLAAGDAWFHLRHGGGGGGRRADAGAPWQFLVLRQRTHLVDYNDRFLRWTTTRAPDVASRFVLRRVPTSRRIDWDQVALVLPWVQDPVCEHFPKVYADLKRVEAECDARGIPIVNRVDAMSNAIKSVTASRLRAIGIRTPRMIPIADATAFRRTRGGLAFPLLVREDCGHGARIVLVADQPALDAVPIETYQRPIAVEYLDTRDPRDGYFRKYRYVAVGDGGGPRHCIIGHAWEVRAAVRVLNDATRAEETDYLANPVAERDALNEARRALGLDVVAFDYSRDPRDGSMIVWEANPAPLLWRLPTVDYHVPYVDRLMGQLVDYYRARARTTLDAPRPAPAPPGLKPAA